MEATTQERESRQRYHQSAPIFPMNQRKIVSVEHPGVIKNLENGLTTLDKRDNLEKLLKSDKEAFSLPLLLRPDDIMSRPLYSQNMHTNNVVLKITVPKRTGRKRKRGSSDFVYDESFATHVGQDEVTNGTILQSHSRRDHPKIILRSLRDNVGRYQVEAVGVIEQTHRYRGLSDFQYASSGSPFVNKLRDTLFTFNLEKIKQFKLDPSRGPDAKDDIIPPPFFAEHAFPYNYGYHQNPAIKEALDEAGNTVVINTQRAPKINTILLKYNHKPVPSGPKGNLMPINQLEPLLQSMIQEVNALLEERPIWTRRAITNRLSRSLGNYLVKSAFQYCAYMFRSGPWRDSLIKFGVDPRSDPKYRIYQTLFFKVKGEEMLDHQQRKERKPAFERKKQNENRNYDSHIFDGKVIYPDGSVWQVCDITDPMVKHILDNSSIRSQCDIQFDGWYPSGTAAKVKVIMRQKIIAIQIGQPVSDHYFDKILDLPDSINAETRHQTMFPRGSDYKNMRLAANIRERASSAKESRLKRLGLHEESTGGTESAELADVDADDADGNMALNLDADQDMNADIDERVRDVMNELRRVNPEGILTDIDHEDDDVDDVDDVDGSFSSDEDIEN